MKYIKLNLKALIVMVFITMANNMNAQFDAMFTQFMFNEMYINPAYAGSKEAMSATLLHRQQWLNFAGRPVTTSFSLHGPLLDNKMGLGLSFLNERIGVLNRNLVYGSYAYRLKLDKDQRLAFGLMVGVHNQVNKFSELKTNDDNTIDPQFSQNSQSILTPNFGAGVYYSNKTFYAGLSIPRMIQDNIKFMNGDANAELGFSPSKYHYYLMVGNLFTLSPDLKLKAQGMVKAVANSPVQVDLNANFLIKDFVWAGLAYRYNASASAIAGVQLNPQFLVSYAFDYNLNSINKYSNGSHELVLNYLFSYKGKKVVTPRYF